MGDDVPFLLTFFRMHRQEGCPTNSCESSHHLVKLVTSRAIHANVYFALAKSKQSVGMCFLEIEQNPSLISSVMIVATLKTLAWINYFTGDCQGVIS